MADFRKLKFDSFSNKIIATNQVIGKNKMRLSQNEVILFLFSNL